MNRIRKIAIAGLPTALAAMLLLGAGCSKTPTDAQITAQVQSALTADAALQGQPITVSVNHGTVTLSGTVNGPGSRELASNDAAHIAGVTTVINNLTTQTGAGAASPVSGQPQPGYASTPAPNTPSYSTAPAPASQPTTIPAGTRIRVQLGQTLSTQDSQIGESFSATVADPVVVNGQVVLPAGASASGTVTDVKKLGHFMGNALLAVRLDSISGNGATYPVRTSTVERFEKGKGKRTAVLTGGGAGVGALLGGLFGGGKGALIGGAIGAGAGGTGSAFTGNKDLVLPAESLLTFRLENDVTVQP
jgi:hypothetical protein